MPNSRKHLLLTGGTGFFGLALLRYLKELGERAPSVTVLSRDPSRFSEAYSDLASRVTWWKGDILVPSSLPSNMRFSHILHAATDSTLGPQLSLLERYQQIVDGTRNILELTVATGANRFLLTSSGGVYGPQPRAMDYMSETYLGMPDPMVPQNVYSVAKRCAEHLCALYEERYGIQTVIARCFAFVGRDLPLDAHFAIGNFIRDALAASQITVGGDGSPIRSYMDQRDLAEWLMALLENGRSGQAYNVGSDVAISIGELAYLVRDTLAPGKPVHIEGKTINQNFRNKYVPSITKAKSELGLNLRYSLQESIHAAINFIKN